MVFVVGGGGRKLWGCPASLQSRTTAARDQQRSPRGIDDGALSWYKDGYRRINLVG